jgi:hypothetical protein
MSLFSSANVKWGYAIRPEDIPIFWQWLAYWTAEVTDDSSTDDCELDENDEPANRSILYTTRRRDTVLVLQSHCLSCISSIIRLWTFASTLLDTLPVTSCSAERALSLLKIIKNRLRSTMSDEWMSDLMVLAAEKAIVSCISCDAIIDCFASFGLLATS